MTYRELIELYRTGKLSEEQSRQIKADIERHEAISEYLFETETIPGLEDLGTTSGWCGEEQEERQNIENKEREGRKIRKEDADPVEERFIKMIRGSIRKAFLKMGICVGVVLLLAVLFIIFGLPGIVDKFYYNPREVAAVGEYSTTNQISLDMAVYSELFLPGKYRNHVVVDSNGYGEYDINIVQNASITGRFYNVAGKVGKGELTLYDVNLLTRPTGNAFVREAPGMKITYVGAGAAGTRETAYEKLYTLNQNEYYMAYITLSEVMTYAEYIEWFDAQELTVGSTWCAVAEKTEDGYYVNDIMGFSYSLGGMCINFDKEKYPHLSMLEDGMQGWPEKDPETMKTHFISMLRYMGDREEFCKMIGADEYHIDWDGMAENIEENGLHIYGFAVQAKPDVLIALSEMEEVCYIYTTPIQ
ncbi:MAG: anti sigma factor C-terminal domain-containing protein [Roseburia sp.]|nr:anti sigma factor C-terminal domain-containing protein [Roseburia sp.]